MMPSSRGSEKPRVSLGLTEIEAEGHREIERRARKLAKHLTDSADPTYLQRIQKLDAPTLRRAAALLAARLRSAAGLPKPECARAGATAKPAAKPPAGNNATNKSAKTPAKSAAKTAAKTKAKTKAKAWAKAAAKTKAKVMSRARRQSSDWRRQRRKRPSYVSRARRLGLRIAAVSTALATAALWYFR